jgi:hypothetical protein
VILQAFLGMNLKHDAGYSRSPARPPLTIWPEPVRGQALLLTAKLGEQDDLEFLYGYLENPSVLLQARALQAIASLQSKMAAAGNGR